MHFDTIRREILRNAQKNLKLANVNLEDLVILKIELPKRVVEAIESKLQQEQLVKEFDFKDSVAERQKRIRIVEASAIKMAEDTINKGLTPEYLQLRQIEAFEKLSLSNNSKTIIVPRSSTPVMFNGQ
jgi:regulator of protease activity HflC (stomatin/prohibitin superfamily)